MLIPVLNAILFIVSFLKKFYALRIYRTFLLLSSYMIFILLMRIFRILEDMSLLVSLLCFVIRYGFVVLKVVCKAMRGCSSMANVDINFFKFSVIDNEFYLFGCLVGLMCLWIMLLV